MNNLHDQFLELKYKNTYTRNILSVVFIGIYSNFDRDLSYFITMYSFILIVVVIMTQLFVYDGDTIIIVRQL